MWVAFRLALAVLGFVIRQLSHRRKRKIDGWYEGVGSFEDRDRQTIGMERRSPTWMRCHAERPVDQLFKRLGIANEVETGDDRFDDLVYVTCDHPYIQALLVESPELRDALVQVFEAGYSRVVFNGSTVAIRRTDGIRPTARDWQLLKQLHAASARLEDELPRRFADPFLWKALVIEGVIWGLAGYAVSVFVSLRSLKEENIHVSAGAVISLGLMVAAIAFVMLSGLIVLTMRGSSRGHRVIVESALLLLLSLPITAIGVVGDTNRALDNAAPTLINRTHTHCEKRAHQGRTGTSYTYHLWLEPTAESEGPTLPSSFKISRELCAVALPGGTVSLTIGPGRWGLPWYRRVQIRKRVWSAPS